MILKTFAVFDIKAQIFSAPFFLGTTGEAVRAFKDGANDKSTAIGRHPEDYQLKCLGKFDNETGEFIPEELGALGFASDYVTLASSAIPIGVKEK